MNKKLNILLAVLIVLQLILPVYFVSSDYIFEKSLINEGTELTLSFSNITLGARDMEFNCGKIYKVKNPGDTQYTNVYSDEDWFIYNAIRYYDIVYVEKSPEGNTEFYSGELLSEESLEKLLWFYPYSAFRLNPKDYAFVYKDINSMEVLYEYFCALEEKDEYTSHSFETFSEGFYTFDEVPIEGEIVLSIYKGETVIKSVSIFGEPLLQIK